MMRFQTLAASALLAVAAHAVADDPTPAAKEPALPTLSVTGPFEVRLAPQALSAVAEPSGLGRMSIDKQFHGALEATSTGEMLSWMDASRSSGGYVAMETVRGTLDGRAGTFALMHGSTMNRGEPSQSITVVPGSGTGALTGLTGRMVVDIAPGGAHSYRFDYTLP